ncbi:MAG: tyrosine--tRNA ligase [Clostridia bacterium]
MRFDKLFLEKALKDWHKMPNAEWLEIVQNKLESSLGMERFIKLCNSNKKMVIKFGIDPTASNIHIGHVVPMMLVNAFLKKGHEIFVIIGDFTAKIGDPSGRSSERKALTSDQIKENMRTYTEQIGMFVDLDKINIRFNSEWIDKTTPHELFETFQMINISQAMQRDDFRKRIENGSAVSLAEVCYSVLMGLDSVALNCDVEIGGIDQLLNFQQCRDVMKGNGLVEEIALMTPILEGTSGDGRKMSKSYGNAIAVLEEPNEKFGKFMSIKDEQIMPYFRCFAFMNNHEKSELEKFIKENPFEAKKQLASFFVSLQAKDITQGEMARAEFERKFSKKAIKEEDCLEVQLKNGDTFYTVLSRAKLMSNSELRRMFAGNAVRNIEDGHILGKDMKANSGKIRVGKRIFVNIE